MRRVVAILLALAILVSAGSPSAFAIKGFGDQWLKTYAENSENKEFKKLAEEAKCNICHIQGENKKKRNEYGEAAHELLKKENFPPKRFKEEAEKVKEEIEAAFKKLEEVKAKDGTTYGEKIKAGKLPGGDKEGK